MIADLTARSEAPEVLLGAGSWGRAAGLSSEAEGQKRSRRDRLSLWSGLERIASFQKMRSLPCGALALIRGPAATWGFQFASVNLLSCSRRRFTGCRARRARLQAGSRFYGQADGLRHYSADRASHHSDRFNNFRRAAATAAACARPSSCARRHGRHHAPRLRA